MKKYCSNFDLSTQCISIESENKNRQRNQLVNFTNACWNLYSPRLSKISKEYFNAGVLEFENSNNFIIEGILQNNLTLLNLSLSATSDKSLHYTFRFKENVVLFIETFLYLNEENHTYIELFHSDKLIFSGHQNIQSGLSLVSNKIKNLLSHDQIFINSAHTNFDTYSYTCD